MKKLVISLALLLPVVSFAQLDFTVRYVKHIKGYPVFEVRNPNHFKEMNLTRVDNGVTQLTETEKLNELALERGLYSFEELDYFDLKIVDGHRGAQCAENYGYSPELAGIPISEFVNIDENFVKSRLDTNYRIPHRGQDRTHKALINQGKRYNASPGHFKNRTNPKWTKYGNCFIVTFIPEKNPNYDPNGEGIQRKTIPMMVVIHYEVFQ